MRLQKKKLIVLLYIMIMPLNVIRSEELARSIGAGRNVLLR